MNLYSNTLTYDSGSKPIVGATISVLNSAGVAQTVYSDNGITVLPVITSSALGNFQFYIAPGTYTIVISGPTIATKTILGVVIDSTFKEDLALSTGAGLVGVTPTSSLVATTVAGAITELDTKKANTSDLALSTGSTLVGTKQSGAGAVTRTVESKLNDTLSAKDFGSGSTITLNVPSQYATIQGALDYLTGYRIANDTTIIIKVADGTYNLTSGINLNHPDGTQIQLIGNTTTPANCVLMGTNPPTFSAISCSNGNTFGLLNGFKIDLAAKAVLANNYSGIWAGNGATIICGNKIEVNNWYYGINSSYNSTVIADYAKVSYAGDVGIWAFVGSYISANFATSNNCSDLVNGWGFGFQAEFGSAVLCTGASATGNNIAGFASLSNSIVRALSTTSNSNTGSGFLTREWGVIECGSATASNNSRYGIEIADGTGGIYGATGTGNTLGQTNKYCSWDTVLGSARMSSSSGSMRLDTNGADSIYFNTSGGLQLAIDHSASSVNCFHLKGGATGNSLSLTAQGTDANIGAFVSSKGAGFSGLNSNGKVAFQAYNNNASNVNYLQANGSLTEVGVTLSAQGTDAVIDLILAPKGAGSFIQINAGYTATTFAQTGYISVKDNTGTVRRLMVG